jgi:hypothetical protein
MSEIENIKRENQPRDVVNLLIFEKLLAGESNVRIVQFLMQEYKYSKNTARKMVSEVYRIDFNNYSAELKQEKREQRISQLSDIYQHQMEVRDYAGAARTVDLITKIEGTATPDVEDAGSTFIVKFGGYDSTPDKNQMIVNLDE